MGLEIYKPGQGRLGRMIAYGLGASLVLFGGLRLYAEINRPGQNVWAADIPVIGQVSLYNVIALGVVLLGFLVLHLILNRPGAVDALVDTEQELRKVSWPSKVEVRNATVVVVLVTFSLAIMLFGFDRLLRWVFQLIY